jgi:hypothetical protein
VYQWVRILLSSHLHIRFALNTNNKSGFCQVCVPGIIRQSFPTVLEMLIDLGVNVALEEGEIMSTLAPLSIDQPTLKSDRPMAAAHRGRDRGKKRCPLSEQVT